MIYHSDKIYLVVLTFNRINLLKECINSILSQSNLDFELVIADNASTDGTQAWLRSLQYGCNSCDLILRDFNIGASANLADVIRSKVPKGAWLSVICDDDTIEPNFVAEARKEILNNRNLEPTCICFSHREFQSIIHSEGVYHKNVKGIFYGKDIVDSFNKGDIRVAGISGFFFKSQGAGFKLLDYPRGFLADTYIVYTEGFRSCLISSDKCVYNRRAWDGQESFYSDENMFMLFKSFVMFQRDLESFIHQLPVEKRFDVKPPPLRSWFFIFWVPILTSGSFRLNDFLRYLSFARSQKSKSLHYVYMFIFLCLFASPISLNIRVALNLFRKRITHGRS
ncbi:glycosyltransferase family 2 protein [Roseobacter sp. HKCC-CH-9208]|uniref:glycosyltransferase family 2 protein n=1 Tax=Roseobacter sp. HKCC-CH-9208 TaxID=3120339 RepID=UPI0030EE517C